MSGRCKTSLRCCAFALSMLLVACAQTQAASESATSPSSATSISTTSPDACAARTQPSCMASADCKLEQRRDLTGYVCRPNAHRCEQGFVQQDGAAGCTARAGCAYDPGFCYCPPDVVCVCGGGQPPQCREAK